MAIIIAIILGIASGVFRTWHLAEDEPQADEKHWTDRSAEVLIRAKEDPLNITTHLTHPGVPPTLLMAASQSLLAKVSSDNAVYHSKLGSSRVPVAILSSLVVPVVLLMVSPFIGLPIASIAAFIIALDPFHIGVSRMAHLDGSLCVFIVFSVLIYWKALTSRNSRLKLIAGFFWGLALATKSTAVILVLSFLIYRFLGWIFSGFKRERFFIDWYDIGAVLLGHIVLMVLYTRLWMHESHYLYRLGIESFTADFVWHIGTLLNTSSGIVVFILLSVVLIWIWQRHRRVWIPYFFILLLALLLVPQVLENVIRFWHWTAGLSEEVHHGFHVDTNLEPVGYFSLFLLRTPFVVVLGILLAIFELVVCAFRKTDIRGLRFIGFLLLISLVWLLFLSVSDKQSWRYALPVVPFIYIVSAFGYVRIARIFLLKRSPVGTFLMAFFAMLPVLASSIALATFAPHYAAYESTVGTNRLKEKNIAIPHALVGQNELIDYLYVKHKNLKRSLYITVEGEAKALAYNCKRLLNLHKCPFSFGYFKPGVADYLVTLRRNSKDQFGQEWKKVLKQKPVFEYTLHEQPYIQMWSVNEYSNEEKLSFFHYQAGSFTGRRGSWKGQTDDLMLADPERDKPGQLLFHAGINVPAGKYLLYFELVRRRLNPAEREMDPDKIVLKGGLRKDCQATITADELRQGKRHQHVIACEFQSVRRIEPAFKWFGGVPVGIGKVHVEKIG